MLRTTFAKFKKDQKGSVAIEFAFLGPLIVLVILAFFDIAISFFVGSALDLAVERVGRGIRTGQVAEQGLTADKLKTAICNEIALSFECSSRLLLKIDVVPDITKLLATRAINDAREISVEETFNPGKSGDVVSVEAFLPWPSALNWILSPNKTKDGEYVIGASDLFKNEPF